MTDLQRLCAYGALLNAALYMIGVFVVAYRADNKVALILVLATAGVSFLSYSVQMWAPESKTAIALSLISILVGLAAGIALLW